MILKVSGISLLGLCCVLSVLNSCWCQCGVCRLVLVRLWFVLLVKLVMLLSKCILVSSVCGVLQVIVSCFMFMMGVDQWLCISMLLMLCILIKCSVWMFVLMLVRVLCSLCKVLGLNRLNISRLFFVVMWCYFGKIVCGVGFQCSVRFDYSRLNDVLVNGSVWKFVWVKLKIGCFFSSWLSYLVLLCCGLSFCVCVSIVEDQLILQICVFGYCVCSIVKFCFRLQFKFSVCVGVVLIQDSWFCM